MNMRIFLSLLWIFAFAYSTRAQSKPQSFAADRAITEQSGLNSETYSDTLAMIKVWRETEESDELGRLFAIGDLRTSDLLVACNDADEEIASLAFLTLHLLGESECVPCGDMISRKHNDVPFVCGANIADADFNRIERWLAKKKNGNGFGMGLAIHRSFLTYVATVVQVEMDKDGKVKVARVDSAVDAGTIVNPEMARQQFEGAATFTTSLAFYGEITAKNGVIQQSNFDNYPMARMNTAPRETFVHLVDSDRPPAGIGEPGVPPFAPALCNAVFAATGKRVRDLPFSKLGLA